MADSAGLRIVSIEARDVRWPTSRDGSGSDAMHAGPDYSCVYVTVRTASDSLLGFGMTFTLGRGTDIVRVAVETLAELVCGRNASDIFANFGVFWRTLTSESQLRWVRDKQTSRHIRGKVAHYIAHHILQLGPEKGVMHLAVAAIVNALWDLWAKLEQKPVWKLLVDMEPEVRDGNIEMSCLLFTQLSFIVQYNSYKGRLLLNFLHKHGSNSSPL